MKRRHPALVRVHELQDEDRRRRDARPELALRHATVDLISGCARQYYADHSLRDDLTRLDTAYALLNAEHQQRTGSPFESAVLEAVEQLGAFVAPRRDALDDLDEYDDLCRVVVDVPTRAVLGRNDEEAPAELLCWNEAVCLLEDVTSPWRCASAISVLGFLGAPDRFAVIDSLVDLRRRYEAADRRSRATLDVEILDVVSAFVSWFATERALPR